MGQYQWHVLISLIFIQEMAKCWFKDWRNKHVESAIDWILYKIRVKGKAASVDTKVAKELPASL